MKGLHRKDEHDLLNEYSVAKKKEIAKRMIKKLFKRLYSGQDSVLSVLYLRREFSLHVILCLLFIGVFTAGTGQAAEPKTTVLTFDKALAPVDNPLKGFMPYFNQNTTFPHSLEWFYVPMKDLMNGPESFTFNSGLETKLAAIASRGNQAVFRVYLDYPSKSTGVPQFLIDGGLDGQSYTNYGGGWSPDYSNAELIDAIVALIEEMGEVYNGDPRIGFITVGFLGFWGEWHTYPHESWFADSATQQRVIQAITGAFPHTRLLLRYPDHHISGFPTGYHDDSFAYATLPTIDWHFLSRMANAGETGAWTTQPVGGEVYPDLQAGIFDATPPSDAEDFSACIEQTHVSWLLNYTLLDQYSNWSAAKQQRATTAARDMGYTLGVTEVSTAIDGSILTVESTITNLGAAPFYYDWPVNLLLFDAGGTPVKQATTVWSLRSVLPGNGPDTDFQATIDISSLPTGTYQLGLQVPNPMAGGKPLRFANQEQQDNGTVLLSTVTIDSTTIDPPPTGASAPASLLLLLMDKN